MPLIMPIGGKTASKTYRFSDSGAVAASAVRRDADSGSVDAAPGAGLVAVAVALSQTMDFVRGQ
jgi:hypothetical protein